MGYRAEKLQREKQRKVFKRIFFLVVLILLVGLCIFSFYIPPTTWKYYVNKPKVGKRKAGEMRLHFLDVGQGDCSLIEFPDGKVMLIDGGDDKESTKTSIMRYLNALKIKTIDYLVVTHADADHCGGLDTVLKYKKVKNALIPNSIVSVDSEYAEFYAALMKENCAWTYASRNVLSAETDEYTFEVLYPLTSDISGVTGGALLETNDNATSSVIWVDYMGVSALFTGDAPTSVEGILLRDDELGLLDGRVSLTETEILKVSHHGSADSTSLGFLEYLGVQTAVISCGKENVYGHPTQSVLTALNAAKADVYRTDLQGHIILTISADGTYRVKTVK